MGIPILLYHGILKEEDPSQIYAISEKKFKEHMIALKQAGYTTINTYELLEHLQGHRLLPPRSIMITFDDGERTSYYNSDPILKELGFKAVMFTIPLMEEMEYLGYVSWDELRTMVHSGHWDVQAHGYKYHDLIPIDEREGRGNFASNLMWLSDQNRLERIDEYEKRLTQDLIKQKELLETQVGNRIIAFAFPFGDRGDSSQNLDADLAMAINYISARKVFPLSFGTVYFESDQYQVSNSSQLIHRWMDNGSLGSQDFILFLEKVTQ